MLMGGGDLDHDALRWFFRPRRQWPHRGAARIHGGEAGEEFYNEIGGVFSVETFVFTDRKAQADPEVLDALPQCRRHLPRRR